MRPVTKMLLLLPLLFLLSGCALHRRNALDNYLQGQLAADQGHLDVALADLSKAIEKNPNMGLAYMARGQVLKRTGDYAQAAADFDHVTKMEPFNFDAHYQLGLMYQYLQKFADAIKAYQKAVEIRPLDPQANMNLALTYTQMGQPLRGLPYAQRAVAGAQESPLTHANLGILYAQLGQDDQAITELKSALELNSQEPQVYLNLAGVYIKQSKFELARNVLNTGRVLAPTAAIQERLGLCYYKLGKFAEANTAYQAALTLDPKYIQALNGLGVVAMSQSLQSNPPDISLAHQATAYWDRSLKIEPNQPIIRQLFQKYSAPDSPVPPAAATPSIPPSTPSLPPSSAVTPASAPADSK